MNRIQRFVGRLSLALLGSAIALLFCEFVLGLLGSYYLNKQTDIETRAISDSGRIRILAIGESTTAGVPGLPEDTYPKKLEQLLVENSSTANQFRVFNLGAPAVTTDFIAAKLPEHLERYRPHVVIAMMGINDGPAPRPEFQVGSSWRIVKLLRLAWLQFRPIETEVTLEDIVEDRFMNRDEKNARLAKLQQAGSFDSLLESARIFLSLRRLGRAEEMVRATMKRRPDHPEPIALLGEIRRLQGRTDDAETLYRRALAVDEISADANCGLFYLKHESDPVEAHQRLRTFVANWPENSRIAEAYFTLARWAARPRANPSVGRPINSDRPAKSDRKTTADTLLVDGVYLVQAGRQAEAVEQFEEAWNSGDLSFMRRGSYYLLISELLAHNRSHDAARLLELALGTGHADDRAFALCVAFERFIDEAILLDACTRRPDPSKSPGLNPRTIRNYRLIQRLTEDSGAVLVAMQYPMRAVAPLMRLFSNRQNVVYVDNQHAFRSALSNASASEIFTDFFAGDFGHMTARGHHILAQNAAETILSKIVPTLGRSQPIGDCCPPL